MFALHEYALQYTLQRVLVRTTLDQINYVDFRPHPMHNGDMLRDPAIKVHSMEAVSHVRFQW